MSKESLEGLSAQSISGTQGPAIANSGTISGSSVGNIIGN